MGEFTVNGHEIIQRTATEHGNGAHTYVPKDWLGAEISIIRTSEADTNGGVAAPTRDPFTGDESPHLLTIGDRDSGIDYSVDRRALRWEASSGTRSVIFCDLHGKRQEIVEAVNGEHVVLDESVTINPLNIKKPNRSVTNSPDFSSYRQKKNDVVRVLNQYIVNSSNTDPSKFHSLIELIVSKTYAKKGITRDPTTHHRENPTMVDFSKTMRELKEEYDKKADSSKHSETSERKLPEDDLISQLANNFMGLIEGGSHDHLRGETSFSINEGGVTYLDINALKYAKRTEQALHLQIILNHLSQVTRSFSDEVLVVIDNSDVLIESFESPNPLEDVLQQWEDQNTAAWFLTDAPEYLTANKMVTKRPALAKQCQSVEFFPSKLHDETATEFGLNTNQAEFLRSGAKTRVVNGEYSEGLVSQSDTSGWTRFITYPSPIEDKFLTE